jgi:ParB family chromosome partitioning protein
MANQPSTSSRKPRLGRGLSSLIVNSSPPQDEQNYVPVHTPPPAPAASPVSASTGIQSQQTSIPIDAIGPNPYQPRRDFNPRELAELTESIKHQGVLQPLIVCHASPDAADGYQQPAYVLIAGERRLRAARDASLTEVPCVVRSASRQQMLEWALVENIQRSDLNPIERAQAYREYMDRFQFTQADVAEKVDQPRATVANHLRLLDLSEEARSLLVEGMLSFGHGKVLASLAGDVDRQLALARKVVAEGLSVRDLERLIAESRDARDDADTASPKRPAVRTKPPYLVDLEDRLAQSIGTRVKIMPGRAKHSGRIVVDYYSLDDFDRISQRLGLQQQ